MFDTRSASTVALPMYKLLWNSNVCACVPLLYACPTSLIRSSPGLNKANTVKWLKKVEFASGTIFQQIVTLRPSEAYTTGGLGQTSAANPARIKKNNYVISRSLDLLYESRVAPWNPLDRVDLLANFS